MTVLVDEDVCRERRNTTASEKEYPSLGGTRPEQKGLRRVMAMQEVKARGQWLLILMLFQSGSSFVLSQYATLVREQRHGGCEKLVPSFGGIVVAPARLR